MRRESESYRCADAQGEPVSMLAIVAVCFACLALAVVVLHKLGWMEGKKPAKLFSDVSLIAIDEQPMIDKMLEMSELSNDELGLADDVVRADAWELLESQGGAAEAAEEVVPTEVEIVEDGGEYCEHKGRLMRKVRDLRMKVTAYSPDAASCGKWADGVTASGKSVKFNGGMLVAADTKKLPFGTMLTIPGYNNGKPVPVEDRGGAIKGNRLDVLYPTHKRALQWGVRHVMVSVWEYVD